MDDQSTATTINSKMNDPVNHPSHYTNGSVECIDAIESSMPQEAFIGYLKGNCIKYLWRAGLKNDLLEDIRKAQWYLNKLENFIESRLS